MPTRLWSPSTDQIANANITAFQRAVETQWKVEFSDGKILGQPEGFLRREGGKLGRACPD